MANGSTPKTLSGNRRNRRFSITLSPAAASVVDRAKADRAGAYDSLIINEAVIYGLRGYLRRREMEDPEVSAILARLGV